MPFLATLFEFLVGAIGFAVLISSFALYETQEGRLNSKLEALWITLDDRAIRSRRQSPSYAGKVAQASLRILNRLVGDSVISPKFVGVSSSLSLCAVFIKGAVAEGYMLATHRVPLRNGFVPTPQYVASILMIGLCCFVVGIAPLVFRSYFATLATLLPLLFIFFNRLSSPTSEYIIGLSLIGSLVFDVFAVAIIRRVIRNISKRPSGKELFYSSLIQFFVVVLVLFLPAGILRFLPPYSYPVLLNNAIYFLPTMNIFTALVSSVLLLTYLALRLHRFLWPIAAHCVYPLQRFPVMSNNRFRAIVGGSLLFLAIPERFHVARLLIERLLQLLTG